MPVNGRLYVRGLNWIGDAVLSVGALQGLKKVRPDIRIVVGAPVATAPIYRLSASVEEVIAPPSLLSRERFDAAVVLPRSFRSAWESFSTSSVRIGYASEGRSLFLTRRLDYQHWKSAHRHQSGYYELLLTEIDPAVRFEAPRLQQSEKALAEAARRMRELVPEGNRVMAINPGAFYGRAKTWPTHHFVALLNTLMETERTLHAILFSGQGDRPLAEEIVRRFPHPKVHSVAGELSLEQSAALLSLCDFLVTNDSGMMHLGGALEKRGIALFGPTDPVSTGPVSPPSGLGMEVLSVSTSCAPCLLRECPIDHRCMEQLSPALVSSRILTLLKEIS